MEGGRKKRRDKEDLRQRGKGGWGLRLCIESLPMGPHLRRQHELPLKRIGSKVKHVLESDTRLLLKSMAEDVVNDFPEAQKEEDGVSVDSGGWPVLWRFSPRDYRREAG